MESRIAVTGRRCLFFFFVWLTLASALSGPGFFAQAGQAANAEQQLAAKNTEFTRLYRAKRYREALPVLDAMLDAAQRAGNKRAFAGTMYNKACVHALLGQNPQALMAVRGAVAAGYTDYLSYAHDSDLDSLRNTAEFKRYLKELRHRHGPKPLVFDRTERGEPFVVQLDDPAHPQLLQLRKEFGLDAVLAGASDDYERLKRLTGWVSRQWQHSPMQTASKTDPLTILREARGGGRFICRDYAVVLAGAARAYGMPSRVLNLLPADVETRSEAHSVAEVWLKQFGKWVLADGQYGTAAEAAGVPLSGLELQAAIASDRAGLSCSAGGQACAGWKRFILPNMHYFKFHRDQRRFEQAGGPQLVLVPQGSTRPRKFAGGHEEVFAGARYTGNPQTFYAPPSEGRSPGE